MTLAQATWWQTWVGRFAALCCALFIFAAMDGLIAQFRQPVNQWDLLPGESASVNGYLPMEVKDLHEIEFRSESPKVRIVFEAVHPGFWMGGNMWRGLLQLDPSIPAGTYSVLVELKGKPSEKPLAAFVVQVHASQESLRRSSKSVISRNLGITPWAPFGGGFLFAALAFGIVYVLTERRDALLADEGRAEVYRVAKTDSCFEVAFGLGSEHGIAAGDVLRLEAKNGETVGTVRVKEVFEGDSTGEADLDCDVRTGSLVSKPDSHRIVTG
ncbi:MAG: hypothetical protein AB9873_05675 [Syntrophobacteraceae bacterium]